MCYVVYTICVCYYICVMSHRAELPRNWAVVELLRSAWSSLLLESLSLLWLLGFAGVVLLGTAGVSAVVVVIGIVVVVVVVRICWGRAVGKCWEQRSRRYWDRCRCCRCWDLLGSCCCELLGSAQSSSLLESLSSLLGFAGVNILKFR